MHTELWQEVREAIRHADSYPEYRLRPLATDCHDRGWRRSERRLREALAERVKNRLAEWEAA